MSIILVVQSTVNFKGLSWFPVNARIAWQGLGMKSQDYNPVRPLRKFQEFQSRKQCAPHWEVYDDLRRPYQGGN